MSYANGTQFYNLPQTVGTDKRDWFDTNSPFAAIDAALHAAVVGQASDAEAIATINGKLATDEADIAALQTKGNTHDTQIAALQTTVNTQANQISDVRQDAEDMITANNEGAAATSTRAYAIGDYFIYNDVLYKATAAIAVGDTIVPNTNCEATNVDTELTQVNNDLTTTQELISEITNTHLLHYARARKYGQVVDVSINGLQNIAGQTITTIFTLPEAYRPSRSVYMNHVVSSYVYQISILENGNVNVFCEQVSPVYEEQVVFDFTYVI